MQNSIFIFILDNISDGCYLSGIYRYLAKQKIRYLCRFNKIGYRISYTDVK